MGTGDAEGFQTNWLALWMQRRREWIKGRMEYFSASCFSSHSCGTSHLFDVNLSWNDVPRPDLQAFEFTAFLRKIFFLLQLPCNALPLSRLSWRETRNGSWCPNEIRRPHNSAWFCCFRIPSVFYLSLGLVVTCVICHCFVSEGDQQVPRTTEPYFEQHFPQPANLVHQSAQDKSHLPHAEHVQRGAEELHRWRMVSSGWDGKHSGRCSKGIGKLVRRINTRIRHVWKHCT